MSLKTKILLPLLIAPLAGYLGYLMMGYELESVRRHISGQLVEAKYNQIQAATQLVSLQAMEAAALFSSLPAVRQAFEIAHQGSIDDENDAKGQEARELLRRELKTALAGYSAIFQGKKFKLHYHLPNGHSLVRLWRDKQSRRDGVWKDVSDDVSDFRNTVLEVNREGKALHGIELGRGGFVLRGVVPVTTEDAKQLGSAEVLMDFQPLMDSAVQNQLTNRVDQGLVLFMNAEELNITTSLRDASKYPVLDNRFVQVYATGIQQGREFIDAALLLQGLERISVHEHGSFSIGVFPVLDYKQRQIGVMAYIFDSSEAATLSTGANRSLVWTLAGIVLLMGISTYLITSYFILAPVSTISRFLRAVESGDNSAELVPDSHDEIGELGIHINQLVQAQRHVLGQIHRAGVQVTSSATQLAATAKEHKATILTQVDSTDKVVESVEEITKVTDNLLQTVEQVTSMSAETANFAASGQDNLAHMKDAMEQMEIASKSISSKLEAINEKNENITSVVTTITKVAEQTNLLSLNAAIEAEKAGEYGHGFNVVAREIRRLADQTAVATLDIDRMVKEMQSAVSAGVMEMDKFISVVRHSAEDVGKISGQLRRIIEQVQSLSPNFESVKVAMEQQALHAKQINDESIALGEGMRQTAETLQESFLAIEQLNEAARGLQTEVERFKNSGMEVKGISQ